MSDGGKLVHSDDFADGLANWRSEGPYLVEVTGGRLRVKTDWGGPKVGQYVWFREDLPADFRAEYDLTPVSESGFFLIFFCAKGVEGEDILGDDLFEKYMPHGSWADYDDFDKYTGPDPSDRKNDQRINCYHISYRRNENANCNFRKNIGKNLLVSREIDALLPAGQTAHVVLTKQAGRIRLEVGGRTFMDHTDDGALNGGVYGEGKLGLRQVYDSEGYYENFKVHDLTGG